MRDFLLPSARFFDTRIRMKQRLPKSIRIHIRKEKARIRARFFDAKEAEEKIRELVETMRREYTIIEQLIINE